MGRNIGSAAKSVGNFISRNISSIFGNSGPPPNMSSYVSLNNNISITNNINSPVNKRNMSSAEGATIARLHQGFDVIEEIGGWMEIGGVLLAPVTEGGSLALEPIGLWHSAVGTAGNIAVDYYEGNYKMMTFRATKFVLMAGIGKAIERIPGGSYMIDKTILKVATFIYDKIVSPPIEQNFVTKYQMKKI